MIARCGSQRIHHWAHKNKSEQCDHWWENETEWHRNWKASFPVDWQEITLLQIWADTTYTLKTV
jgi:competence protein CoiA